MGENIVETGFSAFTDDGSITLLSCSKCLNIKKCLAEQVRVGEREPGVIKRAKD